MIVGFNADAAPFTRIKPQNSDFVTHIFEAVMTIELIIGIGLIAGVAAAGASVVAHRVAKARRWPYVPRYVCGVVIALASFAFPLFAALAVTSALLLLGVLAGIFTLQGFATWLAHDADPDPAGGLSPDADRLLRTIDEELRK